MTAGTITWNGNKYLSAFLKNTTDAEEDRRTLATNNALILEEDGVPVCTFGPFANRWVLAHYWTGLLVDLHKTDFSYPPTLGRRVIDSLEELVCKADELFNELKLQTLVDMDFSDHETLHQALLKQDTLLWYLSGGVLLTMVLTVTTLPAKAGSFSGNAIQRRR